MDRKDKGRGEGRRWDGQWEVEAAMSRVLRELMTDLEPVPLTHWK